MNGQFNAEDVAMVENDIAEIQEMRRCAHCRDTIKPNEGEAKEECPWVHRDGFIRCFRGETVATPREEVQ
jgi:predicted RNA-binding Zn-ribbon protein involved in translation (DUF1610 family)